MAKVPKNILAKRLMIGVGGAIALYFLSIKLYPKLFPPKLPNTTPPSGAKANFSNADGSGIDFMSKYYDASHVNEDGSLGATWISFQDSNVVGYWQKGKLAIGTPMHNI
jgi:hypothetical protein